MAGQIVESLSPEELGGLPALKKEDLLVDVSQVQRLLDLAASDLSIKTFVGGDVRLWYEG